MGSRPSSVVHQDCTTLCVMYMKGSSFVFAMNMTMRIENFSHGFQNNLTKSKRNRREADLYCAIACAAGGISGHE